MAEERLTDDLLKQLLAADRPEDYLDHEQLVSQELTDYREPPSYLDWDGKCPRYAVPRLRMRLSACCALATGNGARMPEASRLRIQTL